LGFLNLLGFFNGISYLLQRGVIVIDQPFLLASHNLLYLFVRPPDHHSMPNAQDVGDLGDFVELIIELATQLRSHKDALIEEDIGFQ
jgi:hypothetical protein